MSVNRQEISTGSAASFPDLKFSKEKDLAMKGKVHGLVGAEARALLVGEVKVPDIDPRPEDFEVNATVTGYNAFSCWYGPLIVFTSPVCLLGSKGS